MKRKIAVLVDFGLSYDAVVYLLRALKVESAGSFLQYDTYPESFF